jgi:cell division septation protein DedD
MFCHDCDFEIKDPELTECPKCRCILSTGLSSNINQEKEETFQDIINILNNDELSELYKSAAAEKNPQREDPFDLDLETMNQNDHGTRANKENHFEKRASTSVEMPGTENFSDGSTLKKEDLPKFKEDDAVDDAIEPKKNSTFTFVLFFVFFLIIAAGAGVLYLKSKQPVSETFPKENDSSIYENKKVFTIINEEIQPVVESSKTEETLKIPEQPTMEKDSSANKETGTISKKTKSKENKIDEKISEKDNSWKTYVPGKQSYYTLQISSLSNRSFAQANLNRLKNKQYPAYILLTRNKDEEMVYKLRIGKYETEEKAKRAAEIFYKKEKMKYIILKSNADIAL